MSTTAKVIRALPVSVAIANAYFIKMGHEGRWEEESLDRGIMRIGWHEIALADINSARWKAIETRIRGDMKDQGAATRDINAVRNITASTPDDVWITFSQRKLWWCQLTDQSVEEDRISKYRWTKHSWHDCDVHGRVLVTADIPGGIAQVQGFRGTVCSVKTRERLERLLNGKTSPAYDSLCQGQERLIRQTEQALKELHWKDFETLVDILFRQAGWRRLSVLGETMKFADLELEEPINRERYMVQIKSKADLKQFCSYKAQFPETGFRKLFFVVHSPSADLRTAQETDRVELILPERLAGMVVNAGLVGWLLAKIR